MKIDLLTGWLEDHARSELDLEAAATLRRLHRVYCVSHELVYAKTHEHRNAIYSELIDVITGKDE